MDFELEVKKRINFIQETLKEAHASGIVFGNSGGKDSALVGVLCKLACENTLGVIMPCHSKRGYKEDRDDALALAEQFNIECVTIDLTETRQSLINAMPTGVEINEPTKANIAPRLRMTALYAVGASRNSLVAGTSNKSEAYIGYFTKYGDGGYDFNPIADLTVSEVYALLERLNVPENIIKKEPSGGLYDGQTDESEIGVTYKTIDEYITFGTGSEEDIAKIKAMHEKSEHKRRMPKNPATQ